MEKIYNIKYVDASYTYAKKIGPTKLSVHEAYGYTKKDKTNIILTFIKRKLGNGKEETALGLVIPETALFSRKDEKNNKVSSGFKAGELVAVTWKDIIIFDFGDLRNDCPTMYTEGILFKIESDHIVLRNPETIRAYPGSIKNHPARKPCFYIIPTSIIVDIKTVNSEKDEKIAQ